MLKISKETIRELCEINLEMKRLKMRYEYISSLAKKAFAKEFSENSVSEEIEIDGYKIHYTKTPRKTYNISLVNKLPSNLIKEIVTINKTQVDKLLNSRRLTRQQCQHILDAKRFDGFNERLYTETVGEQIEKILGGKKKNAKISIRAIK